MDSQITDSYLLLQVICNYLIEQTDLYMVYYVRQISRDVVQDETISRWLQRYPPIRLLNIIDNYGIDKDDVGEIFTSWNDLSVFAEFIFTQPLQTTKILPYDSRRMRWWRYTRRMTPWVSNLLIL